MIQRNKDLGFALETRHAIGIVGEGFGRILSATSRFSFVSRAR
jgi:hypothetical protein